MKRLDMMIGIDMKTKRLLVLAVAGLAMAGCAREIVVTETVEGRELTINAFWEGGKTRTALQADGMSVWWTTDESVNIFFGNQFEGKFSSTNTEPSALAQFKGTLTAMTGTVETMADGSQSYWAVYPYDGGNSCDGSSVTLTVPSVQAAAEGTFADKLFPAVARSSGLNLAFYHVCGGIRFSVVSEGIKSVKIRGNNDEYLAGRVHVTFGQEGHPVVTSVLDGQQEVTVHAPSGGTFEVGKYYFIALLPQSLTKGFTMSFTNASVTKSASRNTPVTVNRSRFGKVDGMDEGLFDVHEAVDLGLSVLWAACNVGSDTPEGTGHYFAWGEVLPKQEYFWNNYKWCSGTSESITKYCTAVSSGTVDNKTKLELEDDAASVNWGGSWRMPTLDEIKELCEQCTWTFHESTRGYTVASKTNGNQIYLPFADTFDGTILPVIGRSGGYWTSEIPESVASSTSAFYLYIESSSYRYTGTQTRYRGLPVRPVKDKK